MEHQRRASRGVIPAEALRAHARETRLRAACIVMTVALIWGVYSVIAAASERFSLRLDLTEGQVFALTDTTREVLDGLEESVRLTYCGTRTDADANLREVLDRYEAASSRIEVDYIDPETSPAFVEEYAARDIEITANGILVTRGVHARFLAWDALYELSAAGDRYAVTGLKAETMLTAAVAAVSSRRSPGVAFTAGHSEDIPDALRALVGNSNYEVSQVVLGVDDLDETVEVVIIAGARRDFSAAELAILDDFMARGGSLCVFRDPEVAELPGLDGFLAEWGIVLTDRFVLEPRQQMDSPLHIIPSFGHSLLNVYFSEHATYLVLPVCRAVELTDAGRGITNTVLRSTSASYGKPFEEMDSLAQGAKDPVGPFTVAATAERSYTDRAGESRTQYVLALACTGFYQEPYLQTDSLGNADLILQALAQMTDNTVTLNIPTKSLTAPRLTVSRTTVLLFAAVFLAALPLGLLLAGVRVFLKRRHS